MESEKYRKFLEHQAIEKPLHKRISTEKILFNIPIREVEKPPRDESVNILDSILLGKEIGQNITIDRRAASLLRYRLDLLEKENLQMKEKIRLMKIVIAFTMAALFSILIYLILYLI